jgi:hypothetical protein
VPQTLPHGLGPSRRCEQQYGAKTSSVTPSEGATCVGPPTNATSHIRHDLAKYLKTCLPNPTLSNVSHRSYKWRSTVLEYSISLHYRITGGLNMFCTRSRALEGFKSFSRSRCLEILVECPWILENIVKSGRISELVRGNQYFPRFTVLRVIWGSGTRNRRMRSNHVRVQPAVGGTSVLRLYIKRTSSNCCNLFDPALERTQGGTTVLLLLLLLLLLLRLPANSQSFV